MCNKAKKKPRKPKLNATSAFGEFPKSFSIRKSKENVKTKKSKKTKKKKARSIFGNNNKNFTSDFRVYYDRGDIPIRVLHSGSLNKIKWNVEPNEIDLK